MMTQLINEATEKAKEIFKDEPYLMPVKPLSHIYGVSPPTVYRLINKGDLEAIRPVLSGTQGAVRVTRDSAEKLMARWLTEHNDPKSAPWFNNKDSA